MTTEDDFHAALDAHPEDYQTRLVFADWLQDCDDPRADGYRALGARALFPQKVLTWWWVNAGAQGRHEPPENKLDADWYAQVIEAWRADHPSATGYDVCLSHPTRRGAEDAAALAFAQLPAQRRTVLLAPPTGVA